MVLPGDNPMKNITYTLTKNEKVDLTATVKKIFDQHTAMYHKNPQRFGNISVQSLESMWLEAAKAKGIFQQLEKDGVSIITRDSDQYYTFADHEGDMFDPDINNNIDPEELKTQRRRELGRFNRNGVWCHTLFVLGEEIECMGGFVGKDFYGSGYDSDFYASALKTIEKALPQYYTELIEAVSLI